ncbi:hypothetical protein [Microbulbifer taiwanensis]|uniref:Uncharacterized protein n=1 Tax=Microbulbifer taiwanensis TaxID=986746 RepID=A0ABW1YM97_9GAMM|nr:hypothetical protein [Microbulbifer taiwanensis]
MHSFKRAEQLISDQRERAEEIKSIEAALESALSRVRRRAKLDKQETEELLEELNKKANPDIIDRYGNDVSGQVQAKRYIAEIKNIIRVYGVAHSANKADSTVVSPSTHKFINRG